MIHSDHYLTFDIISFSYYGKHGNAGLIPYKVRMILICYSFTVRWRVKVEQVVIDVNNLCISILNRRNDE